MSRLRIHTKTAAETRAVANNLGTMYLNAGNPFEDHACVLALSGDLGAGKTTFTQGFARAFGITRTIQSPTFVLMKRFSVHKRGETDRPFTTLYHLDCYRLKSSRDLASLKLSRILGDPHNIVLIEWPERAEKLLSRPFIEIILKALKTGGRSIMIVDRAAKRVIPRL